MSHKVVFVKWLDASCTYASKSKETNDPRAELLAQGFLVQETKDTISLSIERDSKEDIEDESRVWLNIPKACIIDYRERDVERAFPPSTRKKLVIGKITRLKEE